MDQNVVDGRVVQDRSVPLFFLSLLLSFGLPFSGARWPLLMTGVTILFIVGCLLVPSNKAAKKSAE